MKTVETNLATAVQNTTEILNILTYTKSVAGLVKRWGPRAVIFGAGIFTTAGVGNPKVWQFISHFFGG
jgi:hypothetical protein